MPVANETYTFSMKPYTVNNSQWWAGFVTIGSTGKSIEGASDVKVSDLLRTVTENYGIYYQAREQVIGWQMWYSEQKKIYESVK